MRCLTRWLTAFALCAFAAAPAFAQQTLPQGAVVKGTLAQTLASKTVNVGDQFTLTGVSSQDGSVTGATVFGHVAAVQRAGMGHRAEIQLAYDRIQFADGTSTDVRGSTVSMYEKRPVNNVAKDVVGALGGMIVGNIIGKWTGMPTNVGGAAGAVGGFLIANNTQQNITAPAGSMITMRLTQPVIRPQATQ
jgi:hypothetical protein